MLRRALCAVALLALAGTAATGAGKKTNPPPGQSATEDRDDEDRAPRQQAPQPMYAPPAYAPAQAQGLYRVLSEAQKRCGAQRGCELDSRNPCPPCW